MGEKLHFKIIKNSVVNLPVQIPISGMFNDNSLVEISFLSAFNPRALQDKSQGSLYPALSVLSSVQFLQIISVIVM